MARFPEEVLMEILVKSPVKSLLRFRCVCKSWYHLIKSSSFIKRHLKHHKNNNNILVFHSLIDSKHNFMSLHSYNSLSIILPDFQIPFNIFSSMTCEPCNGLICFSYEQTIALYNPATRESKILPPPPFQCPDGWISHAIGIGFGVESNSDEYKLIRIVELSQGCGDDYMITCEIYSLSTNTWREFKLGHDFPYTVEFPTDYGTLSNGAIHWLSFTDTKYCILCFNLRTEELGEMKIPCIDLEEEKRKFLTILNGSLAFVAFTEHNITNSGSPQFVEIWMMCQYGKAESWTKRFTVGPLFEINFPILLWKNDAIILESHGRLVSCSLDTHEINDLEIHGHCIMVYEESLVSINSE